jgi:hypothetical protein
VAAQKTGVTRRQLEALSSLQPALASKMDGLIAPDETLLEMVVQEKARRKERAAAEARERRERRAAAVAAREAARAAAAAPAAAALRSALREATYKLPELESVLAQLEELERTSPAAALERPLPSAAPTPSSGPAPTAPAPAPAPCEQRRPASARRAGSSSALGAPCCRARAASTSGSETGKEASKAASVWREFGGSSADGARSGASASASRLMEHAASAIFVHFIPPPLRAEGKRDLPWIVHTCVDGCREARRVSFH